MSRRRRAGLRARLTAAFGLGALLVSLIVATLTYELVRTYLLNQRRTAGVHEAYANARLLQTGLRGGQTDISSLLASLATGPGTEAVIRQSGNWYSTSLAVGSQSLPSDIRRRADLGRSATQHFRLAGVPQLAVSVPLPEQDAVYFEVFSMAELDRTLRALFTYLALAAGFTTIAGAAVGRWASQRVLQPLSEVSAVAVDIAGGQLDARLDSSADTDLGALATSFNSMVDALNARVERDARFASDVSHELRSPLTTLSASVEVLRTRRAELSPPGQQALDLLSGDLERFERLVQDLLEISRFDGGAVHPHLEPVSVVEVVEHTLLRAGLDKRSLHVGPDAADAVVRADKRRLERVLINLFENASSHGGGLREVTVSWGDGKVHIAVADGGPGVPAGLRERVFERFFRGPDASTSPGAGVGLGLSLVSEQVRSQAGRVWVEEQSGGGARFVVELPGESP